jgi:SAM-dependent methyltransferase
MDLEISHEAIARAFAPAVRRTVTDDRDPEWSRATTFWRKSRPSLRGLWRSLVPVSWRVRRVYENNWQDVRLSERFDLGRNQKMPMVWNGSRYFANALGAKRVHLLYLMHLIERLGPKSVLEVGCGIGGNLFMLAARYPQIAFSGIELTDSGYQAAQSIRALPVLPKELADFSPLEVCDLSAHQRVKLYQGSAEKLPFPARSYDLVYTVQAVEQMTNIKTAALREFARVSAGHVAMFEPFAEWNQTKPRRAKIADAGFIRLAIGDLPAYGLKVLRAIDDMPMKGHYGVGLVLASPQAT